MGRRRAVLLRAIVPLCALAFVGAALSAREVQAAAPAQLISTTTTLTSSANPALVGQTLTFTATVGTASGPPTINPLNPPTVTFSFVDPGCATCTTTSSPIGIDAQGVASTTFTYSFAGTFLVTASFSGDTSYAPSTSAALQQQVNRTVTTTILASSANPALVGQTLTFTATVGTASGPPVINPLNPPTVTFSFVDPGCATCTTTSSPIGINAQGLASTTFTYYFAGTGTFLVTASFSGDVYYAPSTSATLQQQVNRIVTTTTLASSANPALVAQTLTFTATVGTASGPPTINPLNPPTVTFSFVDPGCATCTTTSSPIGINAQGLASTTFTYSFAGTFLVTASFSGDTSYTPSSKGIVQLVNSATATATATSVSASPNVATPGQSVALTATVWRLDPAAATPGGSVTFYEGTTSLGSATLSAGQATLSLSTLPAGAHRITAVYGADSTYGRSAGNTLVVINNPSAFLSSSANPSRAGDTVTFTATVGPAPNINPLNPPTVTFSFVDPGCTTCTTTSSPIGINTQGVASTTFTYSAADAFLVTASFSGDATHPAQSDSLLQLVTRTVTTTILASSANPALVGQTLTFTATVGTASGPPVINPLNPPTVTFSFVDPGCATCTTTSSPIGINAQGLASTTFTYSFAGTFLVTASFSGDTSYAPSSSATLQQQVNSPLSITAPPDVLAFTGSGATSCAVAVSTATLGTPTVTGATGTPTITRTPSGNAFQVGSTTVTWSVTDVAGHTATATQTVGVVDDTRPTLVVPANVAVGTGPTAVTATAFVSDATIGTAAAMDNCDGALTPGRAGVPAGNIFPLGTTTITYTATDAAGNTTTGSQTVTVNDTTLPSITAPSDITAEATSPAGAAVTYPACVASDNAGAPTISYSAASGSVFALGSTTVTCTARDAANNMASATFKVTVVDTTAPTITGARAPTPNAAGWNNTDVVVSFACADSGSGIASCTSPVTLSAQGAGQSVSGTATDNAALSASTVVGGINIDKTKPTITFGGNAGTYAVDQMVVITCQVNDTLSGLATSSCPSINQPAYTLPLGLNTITATATDRAGNSVSVSATFTVGTTPTSLCTLTKQFVQSSAKYQALPSGLKAQIDQKVTAACASLALITPQLTPAQKAAAIAAYKLAVNGLVALGYLTPAQGTTLKALADTL